MDELTVVLIAVQATGDSATVVADVSLTPVHEACEAPSPCPFGTIALPGLNAVPVTADKDVRALYPGAATPIAGPLALQLGADVALLGVVALPGGTLVVPVGFASIPGPDQPSLGSVFAVRGWLALTTFPCETELPLPTDSPFDPCGHSYIMKGQSDATQGSPRQGIAVQRSAYDTFAPSPDANQTPVMAVYLIRQVKDPRATCSTDCYGWLMVGRIDPIQ